MNKDVRKKDRPEFRVSSKMVRENLLTLLKLTDELKAIYDTYPKLRRVVGENAWEQLTDVVYRQLLEYNLDAKDAKLRRMIQLNLARLEELAESTAVRDRAGLRDTTARVLMFRLQNQLVADWPGARS